jgi:predicted ribosomally synthesized peptide with nif11-like leader
MDDRHVKTFVNTALADAGLGAELAAAEGPEEIVSLARREGFAFSAADLAAFDAGTAPSYELSADELREVVGGSSFTDGDLGIRITRKKTCGTPCCGVSGAVQPLD